MKFLILTCNTGEGHNSASAAIQDVCAQRNITCDTVDALSFLSERISKIISTWHVRIYRYMPKLFSNGYGFAENHPSLFDEQRLICRYLATGVEPLRAYLMKGRYDAVICAHVFPASMLTELLRQYPLSVKTAFISTDYTCSPITGDTELDLYFIPHADLSEEFSLNGLPGEKLMASGIPVRQAFCTPPTRDEAREDLGLTAARQLVLMCGSMGCGPMESLAEEISSQLPPDTALNVMCGTNEKLVHSLEEKNLPGVRVVGYTKQMASWLAAADLFLTKPGGLSISEAGTVGTPMLFLDTVGGCEARNLAFFTDHGWAEACATAEEMAQRCCELVGQPERLARFRASLAESFPKDAARTIVETLCAYKKNPWRAADGE